MCVSCGEQSQGSSCSMCYGDIGHGNDGYYEEWAREQMRQDDEQEQVEDEMIVENKVRYAGSEWIKNYNPEMSPFGAKVADLLGDLYKGIYHIGESALHKRVEWDNDQRIQIVLFGHFCSFDYSYLTRIVFLCHERCIRCQAEGASNGYIRLTFSKRVRQTEDIDHYSSEIHPTIEEALEYFNDEFNPKD